MTSRDWKEKTATESFFSDISGFLIKKGDDYYYNELLDIKCLEKELVQARKIVRAVIDKSGEYAYFSVSATSDVKSPSSKKKLVVLAFFYYCDADITTELRFKASENLIGGLPFKGPVGMVELDMEGAKDEAVEIFLSGAGNVKGWLKYRET